ncbi:hypothetical protein RHECNPAF_930023 [Rhizobium etli CNPAF512]|nr:hypothetical protein RHECNPAF_930023 [Rhizobium etli CNPAF512]
MLLIALRLRRVIARFTPDRASGGDLPPIYLCFYAIPNAKPRHTFAGIALSRLQRGIAPVRDGPARIVRNVEDAVTRDGDETPLRDVDQRQIGDDELLELAIEIGARRRVDGLGGLLDDLVELQTGIAPLIGEGNAIRRAGLDENGGGDRRIAAEDRRGDGKVEIMVGINSLLMRGRIGIDDLGIDADGGKRLAKVIAELAGLVEIGRRPELQREALAVRTLGVAGLVENIVGDRRIEIISRDIGCIEFRRILRHWPCGGGGITEEDRVDHEFLVDRMCDRLADPEIGEFLAAVIDLDDELVGQGLIAFRDHLDALDLGDAVEIGQRHRREGGKLNFVGFERRTRRRAVGQHAEDDLVELRLVLVPIILIARQPVVFAGLVFGELERAGADERIVGRIGSDIATVEDVFGDDAGDDGQGIADELERRRLGEAEDGGVVVGRIDGFEIGEHQAAEILQRLPDFEGGEGNVDRGERLAVVPGDAVAQLEGDGTAVGRAFPGGGKPRRKPVLAVERGFGQGFDHLAGDEKDAVRSDDGRVEVLGLGIGRNDQSPAARRGLRQRLAGERRRGKQQSSALHQHTPRDFWNGHEPS